MEEKMERKKESISKNTEPKSKTKQVDRVALNDKAIARIDEWISQIEKKLPALRISRTDVANQILLSHAIELSDDELGKLKDSHFNADRFSKWFAQTVHSATKRGENITQEELLRIFMSCQNGDTSHQ